MTTQKLPPIDVSLEEAAQLGYMPNRDDFEREYDPSAEQLVSNLSLGLDDEDVDLVLKLAQVDIYTRRLRERARRKRLVRDYQLIMSFFRGGGLIGKKTKQTKEQRDFRDRFRVFAQFLTSTEFEGILGSMEREKMLRLRMSELCRYRWNGLTRLDECIHFEQHAAAAQHRNTGPYGQGRTVSDNKNSTYNIWFVWIKFHYSTFRVCHRVSLCALLLMLTVRFITFKLHVNFNISILFNG